MLYFETNLHNNKKKKTPKKCPKTSTIYIYNNFILYQKCFSSEKNNSIYPYFVTFELFRVNFGGL